MTLLERGRYAVRAAATPGERAAVLALRARAFRAGAEDADAQDADCLHLMVAPRAGGAPVAACRVLILGSGADFGRSYAARFYRVAGMAGVTRPMAEIGRFCVAPGVEDPDVIRLLWAALTLRLGGSGQDGAGVAWLFGCASFPGADPARHGPALALLGARHALPDPWRVEAAAGTAVPLGTAPPGDEDAARAGLPPLLRSYLAMGARVGAEAAIDRDLDTIHVFTLLEVAAIPPARMAALRALAG